MQVAEFTQRVRKKIKVRCQQLLHGLTIVRAVFRLN